MRLLKLLAVALLSVLLLGLTSCQQLRSVLPGIPPVEGSVESPPYCLTVYDGNGVKVEVCGFGRVTSTETILTGQK